jgi:hypothetical protein
MAEIAKKMTKPDVHREGYWGSVLPNISKGRVIPIISSSFRLDQVFRELAGDNDSTVVEQLIAIWADQIGYPMQDTYNLAQVAQYYFVKQNDDPIARTAVINFLKMFLWKMASENPEDREQAARLEDKVESMRFSDLVQELDYPRFPPGMMDPIRILARFPLPIYITTGQSDFIERALEAEGKKPCTQICFWSGDITASPEHRTNRKFIPSEANPLVYHLYGLEDYPQTLVLSEDDYINFLISVAEDNNSLNPKIPLSLRKAISESQLLLIGYRLSAWDFRVLFRLIMEYRQEGFSPRGMLIQLKNKENEQSKDKENEQSNDITVENETSADKTKEYLEYLGRYFGKKTFDIAWNNADDFILELWNQWNQQRKSQ